MNDFERKLAQQTFREPPRDLRRLILAAAEPAPRASWREWLWPSPAAWAGLAAVWVIFVAFEAVDGRVEKSTPAVAETAVSSGATALLTAHTPRELQRTLDLAN